MPKLYANEYYMQYLNEYEFEDNYTCAYSLGMDSSPHAIGARLNEAMETARPRIKAQTDLRDRSGVPQPTISRILKGVGKKGPETETLKKLASACGVNFNWLNEGTGPKYIGMEDSSFVTDAIPKHTLINIETNSQNDAEQLAEIVSLFLLLPHAGKNFMVKSAKAAKKRFLSQNFEDCNHQ